MESEIKEKYSGKLWYVKLNQGTEVYFGTLDEVKQLLVLKYGIDYMDPSRYQEYSPMHHGFVGVPSNAEAEFNEIWLPTRSGNIVKHEGVLKIVVGFNDESGMLLHTYPEDSGESSYVHLDTQTGTYPGVELIMRTDGDGTSLPLINTIEDLDIDRLEKLYEEQQNRDKERIKEYAKYWRNSDNDNNDSGTK